MEARVIRQGTASSVGEAVVGGFGSSDYLKRVVKNLSERIAELEKTLGTFITQAQMESINSKITELDGRAYQKQVLNMQEVSEYMGLSKSKIYKLCAGKQIPYYKSGRYNYFDRSEVEEWIKSVKIRTNSELEADAAFAAENYLVQHRNTYRRPIAAHR